MPTRPPNVDPVLEGICNQSVQSVLQPNLVHSFNAAMVGCPARERWAELDICSNRLKK